MIALTCPLCRSSLQNLHCPNGHIFAPNDDGIIEFLRPLSPDEAKERHAAKTGWSAAACTDPLNQTDERDANAIVKEVSKILPQGAVALEIGAGYGNVANTVARTRPDSHIVATDLVFVQTKFMQERPANVEWFVATMDVLPFADESFDLVWCKSALHHAEDLSAVLKEMSRILKPGGIFVIFNEITVSLFERSAHTEAHAHGFNDQWYTMGDYVRAAKTHGFKAKSTFPELTRRHFVEPPKPMSNTWKKTVGQLVHRVKPLQWIIQVIYPVVPRLFIVPVTLRFTKKP